MNVNNIVDELIESGIQISVQGDELKLSGAKENLTAYRIEQVRQNKEALIRYFRSSTGARLFKDPIPNVSGKNMFAISSSQKRIWITSQFPEANVAYNSPRTYIIKGKLNLKALEYAFNKLIQRHESLRTVFKQTEGGEVQQVILPIEKLDYKLVIKEVNNSGQAGLREMIDQEIGKPFDLQNGPLIRSFVYQLNNDTCVLLYLLHHIISDGWSMQTIIKELFLFYYEYSAQHKTETSELKIQYKDYAAWQQNNLKKEELKFYKEYWVKQFEGNIPVLDFPSDYPRPAVKTFNGGNLSLFLDLSTSQAFKQLIINKGATLYMGLVAALNCLLYKYTGKSDLIIGSPIAGREHPDLHKQIGLFLNTLALRTKIRENDSYLDVLDTVKEVTLGAYEHQFYPFDELIQALKLPYDPSRSPLFDVLIDFEDNTNANVSALSGIKDLEINEYINEHHAVSKFDLTFHFINSLQGLHVSLEYNSDLFTKETANRLLKHLLQIIKNIVKSPSISVEELDMLVPKEKEEIIKSFAHGESVIFPKNVLELFETSCIKNPESIAVKGKEHQFSYKEINAYANSLAYYLVNVCEVNPGDRVGLMLYRSEYTIVSLLAILKCNAVFVPIDPNYPRNRKQYLAENSGISCLITQADNMMDMDYYKSNVLAIDAQWDSIMSATKEDLKIMPNENLLAYIIYTSGSTGNPKGCSISMKSLSNYINWANTYYFSSVTEQIEFPFFTSLSFDLTITSIFCPLTTGGTISIYSEEENIDSVLKSIFSGTKGINCIKLTPSHINILRQWELSSDLSVIIVGGESMTKDHLLALKKISPNARIFNEFGPTEATVGCIVKELFEKDEKILIGRPIANTTIYVLNELNTPCAIGVQGQIYIGGQGLADCYWNNEELTAERFVTDWFNHKSILYKTGDLARWNSNGQLDFLGRMDDQLKIRGYRIEPNEIESALQEAFAVESCAVVAYKNELGHQDLVAYLVTSEEINTDMIRQSLLNSLPAYMIPSQFMTIDKLPLTYNGKLDKSKLPVPNVKGTRNVSDYIEPRNKIETELVNIYEEQLKKHPIGIRDNFFALGGDSLKAITLLASIRKKLGIEIDLATLYGNQSIEMLSEFIKVNGSSYSMDRYMLKGLEEIDKIKKLIEVEDENAGHILQGCEDIYPITQIELGMIYSSLATPDQPVYYDQFSYFINIEDVDKFKNAFGKLIQRHSNLRARYYVNSFSLPVKAVFPSIEVPLFIEDIEHLSEEQQRNLIREYTTSDLDLRLKFDTDILWRARVFKLSGNLHYITYSFHHALLDGWSIAVFKTELSKLHQEELPPLTHNYKHYTALAMGKERSSQIEAFWQDQLKGYSRNKLPFNYTGKIKDQATGMKKILKFASEELINKLVFLSTDLQISFKSLCLAAHVMLLHKISSENEIVTGIVTHDRPEIEDAEKIMGCFLNTVPVKVDLRKIRTFKDLLKQMNSYLSDVKPYELHLTDVAKIIGEKTSSQNPIFDTIFNYTDFYTFEDINQNSEYFKTGDLSEQNLTDSYEMTNTLFDVEIDKTLNFLSAKIKYSPLYFSEEEVSRAVELYLNILEAFATNVELPITDFDGVTKKDLDETVFQFNATKSFYKKNKTIQQLFEDQVERTPDNIALSQDGKILTYLELNKRANQLSHMLIKHGVKVGDNVGLITGRSFDMIVGMMGILKSGAAYVPVDPDYPSERQEYILENSNVSKIVSDQEYDVVHKKFFSKNISLSNKELATHSDSNPYLNISSNQLAYTIYTSGSTGKPKGVMIEHHSVINLIEWVNEEFKINSYDKLLFITSMCFDLSVYDVFGILSSGATLIIAKNEQVQNINQLKEILTKEKITFWVSVPSTMNYLVNELELENDFNQNSLRLVFMSGDWIPVNLPDKICKLFPAAEVISLGGATEATVWSNYFKIGKVKENWSSIPYGKPIKNNFFYILDDNRKPVPKGVAGELYIGGVGVARGYANDLNKTSVAFLKDPFITDSGGMMYKTGDLGRLNEDGQMEFLGRKDYQVKIRGYRVELGEIESVMIKYPEIREAVVNVHKDKENNNQLVVYLVTHSNFNIEDLKSHLAKALPSYMVPNHYIYLDQLPLNSNGKIDRVSLPKIDMEVIQTSYVPPTTSLHEIIIGFWKNLLKIDQIGITDNFFDLGANSLTVGALINRIYKDIDVQLLVRDIFEKPTIKEISDLISKKRSSDYQTITASVTQEHYPLSSAQRRLWLLSKFEKANIAYNMSGVFEFSGNLNEVAFENAVNALISRHEILRTYFKETESGEVRQFIKDVGEIKIQKEISYNKTNLEKRITDIIQEPFNLDKAPLLKVYLIKLEDEKWVFVYVIHHIISDGWSMSVIFRELIKIYSAYLNGQVNPLTPLKIQYKDYSIWQNNLISSLVYDSHQKYWLEQFSDEIPALTLPTDRFRPVFKTFIGSKENFTLNQQTSTDIKRASKTLGGTLFMGLLTSVNTLLYKYSGQEDIIIGTPVASRDHIQLESQIGFYANTLALRTRFSGNDTFQDLYNKVKQVTLDGLSHQVYPFDELVEDLSIKRDTSRNPLFDVMVVLQNVESGADEAITEIPGLNVTGYEDPDFLFSKFDLTFNFRDIGNNIALSLEYNTHLFDRETILRMGDHFLTLLNEITSNINLPLSVVNIISNKEKEIILNKFNSPLEFVSEKTIDLLFDKVAEEFPLKTAVVYENKQLTYSELKLKADKLAAYLYKELNIRSGSFVGLLIDRSEYMPVCILAILKLGAAYIPLDPKNPISKLKSILEDSQAEVVITIQEYVDLCDSLQWEVESFRQYACLDEKKASDWTKYHSEANMLWNEIGQISNDNISTSVWKSAFNGKKFSNEEMNEFYDNIENKIQPHLHKKHKVLEVGCGSGILMERLFSQVNEYVGIDISDKILEQLKLRALEKKYTNVKFEKMSAGEINVLSPQKFDVIIVNSVIQYFPSIRYLKDFLHNCVDLLTDNGVLLLGDIRDKELKSAYYEKLADLSGNAFAIDNRGNETELFIDKKLLNDFFNSLSIKAQIDHTEKLGTIKNELTEFRYDSLIKLNKKTPANSNLQNFKRQFFNVKEINYSLKDNLTFSNEQPAYIMYTSGSTGNPKGVIIKHKNVTATFKNMSSRFYLEPGMTLAATTNYTFDISVLEILGALVNGLKVVLLPGNDYNEIIEVIKKHNVNALQITPSRLTQLLSTTEGTEIIGSLNTLLIGGEALTDALYHRVKELKNINVINVYGPTETTIWSSGIELNKCNRLSIGKPLLNENIFILDSSNNLCAIGVAGEIGIAGSGVAEGYLNLPELTSEKFIPLPHICSGTVYKTGDIGRWLPDGNIEFIGRIDNQIKLRGYRIEISEIEIALSKMHGIISSFIMAEVNINGEKELIAYLVCKKDISITEIRTHLSKYIPEHMIPSYYYTVDDIPLNSHGKVDKLKLKTQGSPSLSMGSEFIIAKTETEKKLAKIWQDILTIDKVSIRDNFFSMGGHSLKAVRVLARIKKEFGIDLNIQHMFSENTIEKIAAELDALLWLRVSETRTSKDSDFENIF